MKTVVKFLRPWQIYSPGDIAGFEHELAEKLVKGGAAEPYEEKAKTGK